MVIAISLATCISYGDSTIPKVSADYINNEIMKAIENGSSVNFTGYIIEGDLDITRRYIPQKKISSKIIIANCQILGKVNFRKWIFEKDFSFFNTSITKEASFYSVQFNEAADFRDTKFLGGANFDKSIFLNRTDFGHAQFNVKSTFQAAQFVEVAFFGGADFDVASNAAKFETTRFEEDAIFGHANFPSGPYFQAATFFKNASFDYAHFGEESSFRGALFNGIANFDHAKINDTMVLSDIQLADNLNLTYMQIHRIDIKNVRFNNKSKIFLDESEFDKLVADWNSIKPHLNYDRNVYSVLFDNFRKQGDYSSADDCYYELRANDKLSKNIFLDFVYGYGVKPQKALFACLALVAIFGLIYWIFYNSNIIQAFYLSLLIFVSHFSFDSKIRGGWIYLFLFENILSLLFLAFLIASLVR